MMAEHAGWWDMPMGFVLANGRTYVYTLRSFPMDVERGYAAPIEDEL